MSKISSKTRRTIYDKIIHSSEPVHSYFEQLQQTQLNNQLCAANQFYRNKIIENSCKSSHSKPFPQGQKDILEQLIFKEQELIFQQEQEIKKWENKLANLAKESNRPH